MAFPLTQFEQYIDPTILGRGKNYFHEGAVVDIEEVDTGSFEAQVEGSELYEVWVQLDDGQVEDHGCDCPYDGDPCKHVVAVLYVIREAQGDPPPTSDLARELSPSSNKGKQASHPKPTVAQRINAILEAMQPEQVRDFLKQQCLENAELQRRLLLRFESLVQPIGKAHFEAQVRAILKANTDRHGFIGFREASVVHDHVMELIEIAKTSLEAKDYGPVFSLATTVIEHLCDAMQIADDSNGEISAPVDAAVELLNEMAGRRSLPETLRMEALDYCCQAFQSNCFEGWDWSLDILRLAGEFARTPTEGERVVKLAEQAPGSKYFVQARQEVTLELIHKFQGEEAAIDYLNTHVANHSFRLRLIHAATEADDYDLAISLARDGYMQDKDESPGYAIKWLEVQLQVAQKTKDKDQILTLARQLLDEDSHNGMKYYDLLKSTVPHKQWPAYTEQLIAHIQARDVYGRSNDRLLAQIFEREGHWDRLLTIVKRRKDRYFLALYQKVLAPRHSAELVQLWEDLLVDHLRWCSDRKGYATACEYLKAMKSLGGHDAATSMATFIREEFAKRPAFMDELRRAGF